MIKCEYAGKCSGCSWIGLAPDEAKQKKTDALRQKLFEIERSVATELSNSTLIEFVSTEEFASRDRVDLTIKKTKGQMRVGLYDGQRSEVIDLESCPQMSPDLHKWFLEFRKLIPDLEIGSVRLRVSPDGKWGVWLDLPNIEIKNQLESGVWFEQLMKLAVVEVGQKRKRLQKEGGRLKLSEPKPGYWWETYLKDGSTVGVPIAIGGFSQPGFGVNRKLVSATFGALGEVTENALCGKWVELGSGSGNLTIPLAEIVSEVIAVESDESSIDNLKAALAFLSKDPKKVELVKRIHPTRMNFQKVSEQLLSLLAGKDGMLVDPPRSGLLGTVDALERLPVNQRPKVILYVSCFLDSWAKDVERLVGLGFSIGKLKIVDQFPQTPHFEIVSTLNRS